MRVRVSLSLSSWRVKIERTCSRRLMRGIMIILREMREWD